MSKYMRRRNFLLAPSHQTTSVTTKFGGKVPCTCLVLNFVATHCFMEK